MTGQPAEPLIADYLRRLETAASPLPAPRRTELLGEIRAHIDDALREAGSTDEASVRNVLERLGPPEDIADAALGPTVVTEREPTTDRLATAGLIVLGLGFLVPVVGWLVGAALVVASNAWPARDKAIGLALSVPIAVVLAGIISILSPNRSLGSLEIAVLLWGFAGAFSAIYLWRRLAGARTMAVA